jgi:hypothetical protein
MPNKLTIAFVAGGLAVASCPAFAADIPDYGSKNFSPTGDTPSYFANESTPVSVRTADTTANDWTAEEAAAPTPSMTSPVSSAHRITGRYAKYAPAQRSGKHIPGKPGAMGHSTGSPRASTPKATARHGKASARHAGSFTIDPAGLPKKG